MTGMSDKEAELIFGCGRSEEPDVYTDFLRYCITSKRHQLETASSDAQRAQLQLDIGGLIRKLEE
jgi:hypothetical protein